ncbi:DUF3500 domain-containing protein [Prosthecobacter sp.]|uniref:DUF3500 domain-containing protein n=1 Tax=Prosthecobacter sp. TaxID=1965333 RepID=UPI0037839FA4
MNALIHSQASRRDFIKTASWGALGGIIASRTAPAVGATKALSASHEPMRELHASLSAVQRAAMCFDWDHRVDIQYGRKPLHTPDPKGVLLRAHMANAWLITPQLLGSEFYTDKQRGLVLDVMKTVLAPGWTEKFQQQAQDDYGPWGADQALAFFGTPDSENFECVVTGFHLTLRAGSGHNTSSAFGGGISQGHQPTGFYEKTGHPRNIWWYQSLLANKVYALLDEKQRAKALIKGNAPFVSSDPGAVAHVDQAMRHPEGVNFTQLHKELTQHIDRTVIRPGVERDDRRESEIRFRGPKGGFPGLPISSMGRDQQDAVLKTLEALLEPYQPEYRDQVLRCLKKQGGIDACSMAFYEQFDMGADQEWDIWRIEGPSFVWYFRGAPHVHIWIHVADDMNAPFSAYFG